MSNANSNYDKACAKQEAAFNEFAAIRNGFRAGKVAADVFLAANDVYTAATAEYDAAFRAASDIETSDAPVSR